MHKMKQQSAAGFGRWKQCSDCGATFHSKHWWLGGFKSKLEPPCPEYFNDNQEFLEWTAQAEEVEPFHPDEDLLDVKQKELFE